MFRKTVIAALALMFFAPSVILLGIGALMNPAAANCATTTGVVSLGPVPDSLTLTTANGETFTLNRQQLTHAATIIAIGNSTVFTDEYMYQRTFNEEFILQVMGELLPQKTVSLDIMAKSAFHPGLTAGSQTTGLALLVAVPLAIFLAAVLVLTPRRNR